MKYLLYFILSTVLFCTTSQAQSNGEAYHNRLYYLTKVWGYVKYFHPAVADCTVEWDNVLLDKAVETKAATTDEEFNAILLDLLEEAGEVEVPTSPAVEVDAADLYNLDLSWFEDGVLDEKVIAALQQIAERFRPQNHCLLENPFPSSNPVVENDDQFYADGTAYPDEPKRLLAIARYWNIINYLFPYKYQMDQDWDTTLRQFLPPVLSATNALDYHLAMREMTTYINDSHGFFNSQTYDQWLGYYYAPFRLKYVEGQAVITKVHPAANDLLKVGDVLTAIDGLPIADARDRLRKYMAGSNEMGIERNINNALVRGKQGRFQVSVKNEEGENTVWVRRDTYTQYESLFNDVGPSYELKTGTGGCQVGYVHLGRLTPEQVPQLFETMKDVPALIMDIRNYPNGTLWNMVDYLYTAPINFAAFTVPDIRYPGRLNFEQHSIGQGGRNPYDGKLVLLFDEVTQSQAEFTIMGLEVHPEALKIGSQTAGADGNISRVYLPGNIRTVFTGLGVFYPDGRKTQRIGIQPDITFYPSVAGIRAGTDEMLDFALNCELLDIEKPFIESEDGVEIFPNPTADLLNVKSDRTPAYTVQIRDALGRLLEEFQVAEEQFFYEFNLKDYPSGIYWLTFFDEDEVFAVKSVMKS